MMRRVLRASLAVILAAAFLPPGVARAESSLAEELAAYQAINQRLQDIGWKLAHGNARFCPDTLLSSGLQLQDVASYGTPDQVRTLMGLEGDFAVLSVASGSPASGTVLKAGMEVVSLDEIDPSEWPAEAKLEWRREKRLHDTIDTRLAYDGDISIGITGGDVVNVTGEAVCSSRFELAGNGKRAVADGARVQIGTGFVGITYSEDEFAAAIAHELAHNILKHREWLDTNGRKRKLVRATEREADRLMPWLLANSGYEPGAALRFMKRWGPQNDGGIFRKRTHDGWDERAETIRLEIEVIEELRSTDGSADWASHFIRGIELPTDE